VSLQRFGTLDDSRDVQRAAECEVLVVEPEWDKGAAVHVQTQTLGSWNTGVAKDAIVDFVEQTMSEGVPSEERIAVFDNDGTLWCEKPMPIQADFIFRRLAEMAQSDPELRTRQPWKAAYEHDFGWFGKVLADHYAGDDANLPTLAAGILGAFEGISVEDFESKADAFLRTTQHPTLDRPYVDCAYAPMVELLGYLEANGFSNYIASGGGRDFMRPVSQDMYGVPRDRVIGSSTTFSYTSDDHGGTISHDAKADYLDDGPQKPVRIWSRIGRRPVLVAGNSNGDLQMLEFTAHDDRPVLRLLVLHDDGEREFDYTSGAEDVLKRADADGITVVSMKDDWAKVF
jgi:phosphoglycolate phosphatase-like HAD superfamily hydrolase